MEELQNTFQGFDWVREEEKQALEEYLERQRNEEEKSNAYHEKW